MMPPADSASVYTNPGGGPPRLGHLGRPMSDPSLPRVGFFPFKDRGFETFIRRDLIVRVCFLASVAFLCLVKTRTSHQQQ